ncbi:dock homology region 2 domain-containing protein [Ditylenchus destructor]|nr:dock homology region 2 domain-containing protein [Ditylenchus destructor]
MMLGNTVEAALTLKKHASLLNWNEELVEPYLMASKSRKKQLGDATTHLQLKESIYVEIADLLEKGEHWEQAIEVLKELVPVYESILFDSQQLADLMRRLADLYTKTISTIRMEYNYFLVAFYGKDAPEYLSKRKFIFRGEKLEQWGNFKQRIMSNYFGFKFVESMEDCEDELQDEKGKYIQIVPVTAQPSPKYIELNKSPHRLSRWYYKHHQVLRFEQHRREIRPDTKWTALDSNDATKLWLKRKIISIEKPLPDILKFAQVVNEHELEISNPVEVAMLQMQDVNEALSEEAQLVNAGFDQNIVNLGGRIRGVVQANVGGGVKNYQTFFTKECDQQCTESEKKSIHLLKNVLLEHVAIVEYALYVYTNKSPQGNETFHNLLLQSFNAYKQNIEEQSKQKAPSILPPGANISFDFNSSASEQNSNLTTPNSTTHRPHFSQERSISMTATSEAGTPIANHSTLTSTSTVLFRQVPKAFLRSTMGRGKANIGSPSNTGTPTKKTSLSALGVHATSPVVPSRRASGGPLLPPLHMPGAHEFTLLDPSAFSSPRFSSNSNMSDTVTGGTSTSNASSVVVMSSTLTHPRITAPDPPLLPPRRSSVHSSELRQRKMSVN